MGESDSGSRQTGARLVRDAMHPGLITCTRETAIGDAAALLRQHRVHALVVAEAGRQVGILSDTDLLAGEWLAEDPRRLAVMRRMTAGELMSAPIAEIGADELLSAAAARMQAEHLARLLVREDGGLVGVLSVSDLVGVLGQAATGRRLVRDAMSWGVVACRESTSLAAAARLMTDRRSRSVLVVDPGGRPVGVLTGWDLLRCLTGDQPAGSAVTELMQQPVTVSPDATLAEAADLMLKREIHRLVVVDPQDPAAFPIGLIATSDFVAEMSGPESDWR